MEDDRTTDPTPPSEGARAEAEDTSPHDGPADPEDDPETEGDAETGTDQTASEERPPRQGSADGELPRTTTTGDDEQDLRSAGDGAVSGAPGDDLDDPSQRHD